jgi:hypothetical protein
MVIAPLRNCDAPIHQSPISFVMAGISSLMALTRVAVLGSIATVPFKILIAFRPSVSFSGSCGLAPRLARMPTCSKVSVLSRT